MSRRTVTWLLAVVLVAPVPFAEAQQVIFLVRHAEQDGSPSVVDDPALTEVGHRRAQALAQVLKDAGINVVYTTERRRGIQTAEPIAKLLNIEPKRLPMQDSAGIDPSLNRDGLISRLRSQHVHDRVLVVSHSWTLPRLLKALGHPVDITISGTGEYDNLFVIIPKGDSSPLVLRLRY
jgi:2,3-bisphosphoglycerate-dependent phosphoglycerate mutase